MACRITPRLIERLFPDERFDAGETATFARQLESIAARTYDVVYPELKAELLIPAAGDVNPGAEYYTWRSYDRAGQAVRIANYADDLPRVDVKGSENTTPIAGYGDSYGYSIQDLRRAKMAGVDLDQKRALTARELVARKIDAVAAFGDSAVGIPGFLNNSNVPLVSPATGGWATATDLQILNDLYAIERAIVQTTKDIEQPDTLVLGPTHMGLIATKPLGTNADHTILEVFLKRARYIKNVESWYQMELANAGLNGPRVMAYRRDPTKVELVLPVPYDQEPPQAKNLAFVVNCHARCGGTVFHYPKSAAYMDGC